MGRKAKGEAVMTVYDRQAAAPEPAVLVFGMSDKGLPEAAWFSGADAEAALLAARLMSLHAAEITTDRHKALAGQLQQGQAFASERLFAPIVGQELYNELFEVCGASPAGEPVLQYPTSWEEIRVGSVVLAVETEAEEGWFEAIVLASNDHLLQLRWKDAPRDASFICSRSQVALLPAVHVDEAA